MHININIQLLQKKKKETFPVILSEVAWGETWTRDRLICN